MGSIKTSNVIRSVYINEALDQYLRERAERENRTVSQVLSMIIEKHVGDKEGERNGNKQT